MGRTSSPAQMNSPHHFCITSSSLKHLFLLPIASVVQWFDFNICHHPCVYLRALMGTIRSDQILTNLSFSFFFFYLLGQYFAQTGLHSRSVTDCIDVCPMWSVNCSLDWGGAVTTNSNHDPGLTLGFHLRITCVSLCEAECVCVCVCECGCGGGWGGEYRGPKTYKLGSRNANGSLKALKKPRYEIMLCPLLPYPKSP